MRTRIAWTRIAPIASFQGIQFQLSDMATDDGPDPDRARDEQIDMELMER